MRSLSPYVYKINNVSMHCKCLKYECFLFIITNTYLTGLSPTQTNTWLTLASHLVVSLQLITSVWDTENHRSNMSGVCAGEMEYQRVVNV